MEADAEARCAAEAGCTLAGLLAESRHARIHAARRDGGTAILKVASPATMADATGRARFAREGRLGLSLHHPSLVETLACGADWILLGDLRGPGGAPARSLEETFDASRARRPAGPVLAPVGSALAHLHARGLVHRDVKPGNILLGPDGHAVLIDLGIVGLTGGDALGPDEMVGSPAWMAPEQLGGGPPRPEADLWSLAALLAFCLCGVPPYAGTADAVLERRRAGTGPDAAFAGRFEAVAGTPLGRLAAAGLAADPSERPPLRLFLDALASEGGSAPG